MDDDTGDMDGGMDRSVEDVSEWLGQYPWFKELPVHWKQVTYRLARELSPEKFVGLSALHLALGTQDESGVWDALEGESLPPMCEELLDRLMR